MLPFVLVLLIAQGVFAAPSIVADFYNYDGSSTQPDNDRLVNSYITDGTFAYIDGGDTTPYGHIFFENVKEMSNVNNPRLQAAAVLQTLAFTGELATGIPGDSCASASVINAYVRAKRTGNNAGLRTAVASYVHRLVNYIDTIVLLVSNPNAARYSSGPKGNCLGGGRNYQFEDAWEVISEESNPVEAEYLNLEYCANKRMYTSSDIRSNNIAAGVTAATVGPVLEVAQKAIVPLAQFLRAVTINQNVGRAAEVAKSALYQYV